MRFLKTAVSGGLLAGTIDIGAASAINMVAPDRVLRAVASGLLGRAAVHGGSWVIGLGLILQWAMSTLIAAIFLAGAARLPIMLRRWILAGLAYGFVVFFVMNYAVVPPLSAAVFKMHFTLVVGGKHGRHAGLRLDRSGLCGQRAGTLRRPGNSPADVGGERLAAVGLSGTIGDASAHAQFPKRNAAVETADAVHIFGQIA